MQQSSTLPYKILRHSLCSLTNPQMNPSLLDSIEPRTDAVIDPSQKEVSRPTTQGAELEVPSSLPRPAWIEIDLQRLSANFQFINQDKPKQLRVLSVVKDDGYGHGALAVARAALSAGANFLALSTLQEAITLREQGVQARLLMLGDRQESEFPWCVAHDLTCCVSESQAVLQLSQVAARANKRIPVHLKINTGMNRYGVRWTEAAALAQFIESTQWLYLEGVLSHFAQSDELDKTFALVQLSRFEEALRDITASGITVKIKHLCNSGGFLDLPLAHFDMVRLGILPLGIYPSSVCRRIPGIEPAMTIKARIAAIQNLQAGDSVGYGMRYIAPGPRRIAVLPIGYGDGFPRVRNQGCALVHGHRAPLLGGVAMDAITVDITEIPAASLWDEAVILGRQGCEEISVHELAKLKNSVSYDLLAGWRTRLPRIYRHAQSP